MNKSQSAVSQIVARYRSILINARAIAEKEAVDRRVMPTPKDLYQAIINGMVDSNHSSELSIKIEQHVKDFLRQRIGALMLSDDAHEVAMADKLKSLLGL